MRGIFYKADTGSPRIVRCPKCDMENYAINVTNGTCSWCGFDANKAVSDWNGIADEYNKWSDLSNDERDELIKELVKEKRR